MQGFFTTMMRYIDSGDDVGVALSPQLMFNVVPDCDIFNHQNLHFWEMMHPGMDALGFISLKGAQFQPLKTKHFCALSLRTCGAQVAACKEYESREDTWY